MRKFRKSSTAVLTVLALALMPVLPAAAQTLQGGTSAGAGNGVQASRSLQTEYTVRTNGTVKTGNLSADGPITITVEQKPGTEDEDLIITWKEDPRAKAEMGKDGGNQAAVEYEIEVAQKRGVNAR